MDWIGDRLAHLISEGQKALGKEVVVMSEDQADEVDDGSGAWVEDDAEHNQQRTGRDTPPRSARRTGFGLPPSYEPPRTPARHDRGMSVESDTRSVASSTYREDEASWQTPEMRESMERARMLYKQKRGLP